jgi:selenocysteine-specific elongation factor
LKKLEEMCFKGEFRSASLEELQDRFRLSLSKLNILLSLLIERKKIVQGKDGFFIHSRWLDEIIWMIKESGKRELTVSDFKKMTGLSRKYAIPLLELLDQMGVTRRKGPSRLIL